MASRDAGRADYPGQRQDEQDIGKKKARGDPIRIEGEGRPPKQLPQTTRAR